ncbi:hypothetical protein B296_00020969 [Ensete ventricosum]|uniref:Uncharacterized protein n=1 Tax=Ensete ventricosum TaxID=4639 RepID=A0A426Z801_ENSVE|nr:hypothetical protein B296_00020969 [Ensete ventricosum]
MSSQDQAPVKDADLDPMSRNHCIVNHSEGLMVVDFGGGDAATTGTIGRSEGQREKRYDHGVGKVPLLVGADATVVVHKEDDLVQKNASVEELKKPTEKKSHREQAIIEIVI